MNFGKDRQRKRSVCEAPGPNLVSESQVRSRAQRRSCKSKASRDRDFFAPAEADEWVLPEYRSLFQHLFLKDEDNGSEVGSSQDTPDTSRSSAAHLARRRKISPSGSTASSTPEDDGPLCNLVKNLPSWFKKVFHISEHNEEQQQSPEDRHAWLDEIPIEICDRLRHIHVYV